MAKTRRIEIRKVRNGTEVIVMRSAERGGMSRVGSVVLAPGVKVSDGLTQLQAKNFLPGP